MKLHLRDGSVIEGLGKLKSDNTLAYKQHNKSKPIIYDFRKVLRAEINKEAFVYKLRNDDEPKRPLLLKIEVNGLANLYSQEYFEIYGNSNMGGVLLKPAVRFFVSKGRTILVDYACETGGSKNKKFRTFAMKYFKDCPPICDKKANKIYVREDMVLIVKEYNRLMKSATK